MTMQSSGDDRSGSGAAITTDQVRKFGPPAVIGLLAILFVFQNTNSVRFEFLWFDFDAPLWLMLIVFAGVGAVVFFGVQRRRRNRQTADAG